MFYRGCTFADGWMVCRCLMSSYQRGRGWLYHGPSKQDTMFYHLYCYYYFTIIIIKQIYCLKGSSDIKIPIKIEKT